MGRLYRKGVATQVTLTNSEGGNSESRDSEGGNSKNRDSEGKGPQGRENLHWDSARDRDSEVRDSENRDSESRACRIPKLGNPKTGRLTAPLIQKPLRLPLT